MHCSNFDAETKQTASLTTQLARQTEQLSTKEEQLAQLTQTNQSLDDQKCSTILTLSTLQTQFDQVKAELSDAQTVGQNLQLQIATLKLTGDEAEKNLTREVGDLKQAVKSGQDALNAQIAAGSEKTANFQEEIKNLNSTLTSQSDQFKTSEKSLTDELNQLKLESANERTKLIGDFEMQIASIGGDKDASSVENKLLKDKINSLEAKLTQVHEQLTTSQSENSTLNDSVKENFETMTKFETSVQELCGEIDKLNGVISGKDATLAELTSQVTTGQSDAVSLQSKLEENCGQIKLLESTVQKLTAEIVELKSTVSSRDAKLADLAAEKLAHQSNQSEASVLISEKDAKIEALTLQLTTGQSDAVKLQSRLDANCEIVESLESNVQELTGEVKTLKSAVSSKNAELAGFAAAKVATETHQSEASQIIHNLTAKLAQSEVEFESVNKCHVDELADLERHNKQLLAEAAQKTEKYGANVTELSQQINQLTALVEQREATHEKAVKSFQNQLQVKDKNVTDVLMEKEKCITEMSEKIQAEIMGREKAKKGQAKFDRKFENMNIFLEQEKTKNESLKELTHKMEEEIKSYKIQHSKMETDVKQTQQELMEKESQFLAREEELKESVLKTSQKIIDRLRDRTLDLARNFARDLSDHIR